MRLIYWLPCLLFFSFFAWSGNLSVGENSVFAVITHKAGLFKGAAHNHFVHAGNFQGEMSASAENPTGLQMEFRFPVEDLVIDDSDASQKWYSRIEALAILDEPFSEISEKDRGKIRKSMLGGSQLNAKKYSEIHGKLIEVIAETSKVGDTDFAYRVTAEIAICDTTKTQTFSANLSFDEGKLILEAVAAMKFTDFGIKPYSAMLGAVSNQDEFHVYLRLEAE